jgi:hypothetical protein
MANSHEKLVATHVMIKTWLRQKQIISWFQVFIH